MKDRLIISGLEFFGHCGITVEEQRTGQRFEADIEMVCSVEEVAAEDQLENAIDYATVSKRVLQIGRKEQFRLIETMAERIAGALLQEFGIQEVRIILKKMHPPIEPIMSYAAVDIYRTS